nr:hypothetical protein [Pirellula staleyi]
MPWHGPYRATISMRVRPSGPVEGREPNGRFTWSEAGRPETTSLVAACEVDASRVLKTYDEPVHC